MPGTNVAITSEGFGPASAKSWLKMSKGLQDMRPVTLDLSAFDVSHVVNGAIPSGTLLGKITATGLYAPWTPDHEETEGLLVTGTGGAMSGTFTLTLSGQTTGAIAYNANAAAVDTALRALSNVSDTPGADLTVTGTDCTTGLLIKFTDGGAFDHLNVTQMTVADSVTNGDAAITTVTNGGAAASNGSQTLSGILFESVGIKDSSLLATMADPGAALFWRGVVDRSKMPGPFLIGTGSYLSNTLHATQLPSVRWE